MDPILRILIVEDSEDDIELLLHTLRSAGYQVSYQAVDTSASMRAALQTQDWDIITSDHNMPRFSAVAALALAHQLCPGVPFLIVSGEINLNLAVSLMREGAQDYIQKNELVRLVPAIERELREVKLRHEQQRVDEALAESSSRLREVLEKLGNAKAQYDNLVANIPLGIFTLRSKPDGTAQFDYISARVPQMFGMTADQFLAGDTAACFPIHPEDASTLIQLNTEQFQHPRNFEWEGRAVVHGETRWVRIQSAPELLENGEVLWHGFVEDITARKRVEQELEHSVAMIRRSQEIAHLGSWELDLIQNRLSWSDEVFHIFGMEVSEFGATYEAFLAAVHPDDRAAVDRAYSDSVKFGKDAYEIDHRVVQRNNGEIRYVHEKCFHERDASGNIIRSVGVVLDVTDRKRIEEQIQRLNAQLEQRVIERTTQLTAANRELEAFSYSVSHDLRAPLRKLESFVRILREEYSPRLDERGQHYLKRILENSERIDQLIDDLLNLSRVMQTEFTRQKVDLSALACQIGNDLKAQSAQRRVDFQVEPGLIAWADENLLKIALENLLNNAFKFTGRCEPAVIQVGSLQQDGKLVYFVKDNGAGFDMEYVGKLFGPFQRLHSEKEFPGNGIGLATVQRIIHRHGGQIWAKGKVNEGATFYFTFDHFGGTS